MKIYRCYYEHWVTFETETEEEAKVLARKYLIDDLEDEQSQLLIYERTRFEVPDAREHQDRLLDGAMKKIALKIEEEAEKVLYNNEEITQILEGSKS